MQTGMAGHTLAVALLVTASGIHATRAVAAETAERKNVPFDLLPSNHMLVQAKINGKGPYWLVFDLGAPVTLLSNRAAEETGAIDARAPRSLLFAMRGEAEISQLQLGDLTTRKVPVVVLNHPALKILGEAFNRRIDGIVGYTFFARYQTTIDYQSRQMTFKPVDFQVRNLMKDLPDRLFGPRQAQHLTIAPENLWGMTVAEPEGNSGSHGVAVTRVSPGSAAAVGGLRPGDTIVSIDGRWTTSVTDTYKAAAKVNAGQDVDVVILRGGEELGLVIRPRPGI